MTIPKLLGHLGKFGAIITSITVLCIGITSTAVIDWGFINSEITDYPLHCRKSVQFGLCDEVAFALRKTTYKVLPHRQEVLHWVQGFPVHRLTKCAVRDRKNWSCTYNDGSAEFGFNNGTYSERTVRSGLLEKMIEKEVHVSKWQWMNQRCKDSELSVLICYPIIAFVDD